MVDVLQQEVNIGDTVLTATNGGKMLIGKVKDIYKEDSDIRKIEVCLILLPSKMLVTKLSKQIYKLNGNTETKRENDTEEI